MNFKYIVKITWASGKITYPMGIGKHSTPFPEFATTYGILDAHQEVGKWLDVPGVDMVIAIRSLHKVIKSMEELVLL